MMQFLAERRFNYIDVVIIAAATMLFSVAAYGWALGLTVVGAIASVTAEEIAAR